MNRINYHSFRNYLIFQQINSPILKLRLKIYFLSFLWIFVILVIYILLWYFHLKGLHFGKRRFIIVYNIITKLSNIDAINLFPFFSHRNSYLYKLIFTSHLLYTHLYLPKEFRRISKELEKRRQK